MPQVLIAFDKFKNSLNARQACAIASKTFGECRPGWEIDMCPLADGGEGFAEILVAAAGGQWHHVEATNARGLRITAGFGVVDVAAIPVSARQLLRLPAGAQKMAVLDLPTASGIAQLPTQARDPWHTETTGTGEILAAAAHHGAHAILLGIGGSASNDLGLCALASLGVQFIDSKGQTITPPTPAKWVDICAIAGTVNPKFPPVLIACDVQNPLLGELGCTSAFGPQKGLPQRDIPRMEAEVERMAAMLCCHFRRSRELHQMPGTGAAGGFAFGLHCALGADLVPGAELVVEWKDLNARLARADLLITGEGRFDEGSLRGKGPGLLVRKAEGLGIPVLVLAGSIEQGLKVAPGTRVVGVSPPDLPLSEALRRAPSLLADALRKHLADS